MAKLSRETQISLIESAILGDQRAFAAIHQAYDHILRRTLAKYCRGDESKLDDLSQLVWMQVHRKLGTFKGEADFNTWLTRLAINTALMQYRAGRRERITDSLDVPLSDTGLRPELVYVDPAFARAGDRTKMLEAIDKLPPYARRVLYLRLAGYDLRESAEALGITLGATKSYVHRATKLLAGMMGV